MAKRDLMLNKFLPLSLVVRFFDPFLRHRHRKRHGSTHYKIIIKRLSFNSKATCPLSNTLNLQSISNTRRAAMVTESHHFLLVTIAAQGQINPARHLARRLARAAPSARITLATPLSSHRRLFPTSSAAEGEPDDSAEEVPLNPDGSGVVAYAPYSDGFGVEGVHKDNIEGTLFMEKLKTEGSRTLSALTRSLAARGRPVTCVVYTILLAWAVDVARAIGVPSVLYWMQPASVFSIYYYYFHGHTGFAASTADPIELPGLPPLREKDLPSIITTPNAYSIAHKDIFVELDKSEKPVVLVNTFRELEVSALEGLPSLVELFTVGPVVDNSFTSSTVAEEKAGRDLFEEDAGGYMEWLDAQEERSVVYVSFGSLTRFTARQVEEMSKGLKASGRPHLWVMRRDSRAGVMEMAVEEDGKGMVVEWCSQVLVLGHRAVGCFVTHCGWNSTSEALVSGVPMVMMPQWIDQTPNARMAEAVWGVGVRVDAGEDGVVEMTELVRGLEVVMGGGEKGTEIKRNAEKWKEKAKEALAADGASARNLRAFVDSL